jgi:histidine triad (HIT) family protein
MRSCVFCKIANGDIPAKKVYEDGDVLAFWDLEPQAPVHILVIPKRHVRDVTCFATKEDGVLLLAIMKVITAIAEKQGIADSGFRVVANTGVNGGQTVDHVHFHILGGRAMSWPPG